MEYPEPVADMSILKTKKRTLRKDVLQLTTHVHVGQK